MDQNPDRAGVIDLLEKLGDEDDAAVLAAARALHGQIGEMGLTWDELLVPDDDGEAEEVLEDDDEEEVDDDEIEDDNDDDDDEVEVNDGEIEDDDAGASSEEIILTGDAADDVKVIERLLARAGISEGLREELTGYKEDITEGDFTESDRNYLHALQKRLSESSKKKAGKRAKK